MKIFYKRKRRLKGLLKVNGARLVLLLFLVSCKTHKPVALSSSESSVEIREVEKLVPYALPSDSITLEALFQCDSTNKVLLSRINSTVGKGLISKHSFEDGKLSVRAYQGQDTIYLPVRDVSKTEIKQSETVSPAEAPKKLPLQSFFWWSGLLGWLSLVVAITYRIAKHFK